MAYTPKTWQCGETITADGLNNIEDGIQEALECCGGGTIVFTVTREEVPCPLDPSNTALQYTYSHSWQELYDALGQGKLVLNPYVDSGENGVDIVMGAYIDGLGTYVVHTFSDVNFAFSNASSKTYLDVSQCGGIN